MALSDKQRRALRAKLSYRHVKTRSSQGATLSYVEGWHAIAEANRIFGYDSWDRQTQSPHCIWSETQRGQTVCFYSTKVRITVRAGDTVTVREGIGTGIGRSPSAELAHEIALKAAETDATKRALATFGNPFGLALYDKDQAHVTKAPQVAAEQTTPSAVAASPTPPDRLIVRHLDGRSGALRGSRRLCCGDAEVGFRAGQASRRCTRSGRPTWRLSLPCARGRNRARAIRSRRLLPP